MIFSWIYNYFVAKMSKPYFWLRHGEHYFKGLLESFNCLVCGKKFFIGGPYCLKHLNSKLGLEIKKSDKHGFGVFATRNHEKDKFLMPYAGKTYSDFDDLNEIYEYSCPIYTIDYTNLNGERVYDDGAICRGVGTLCNAADCGIEQNASIVLYDGKCAIMTNRRIKKGEEILVDYGPGYQLFPQADYGTVPDTLI